MPVNLTDFSNDKYLVLKALHDSQTQVGKEMYVPFTQKEISVIVGFSRPKTNQLMKELVNEGYVSLHKGVRGNYVITQDGLSVIKIFERGK